MKYLFVMLSICLMFSGVASADEEAARLSRQYSVAIHYEGDREIRIPLPVLEEKPIRATLNQEIPFLLTDGIHLSADGRYLDALCRFTDIDEGQWEVRISGEPLMREGYSLLTVGLHPEKGRVQQIDFTFRGTPGEKLNVTLPPFTIIGLRTPANRWFSLVLLVE